MAITRSTGRKDSEGFALLIAIIFMSVMLSLGLMLGSLGYKQEILASGSVASQYAFYVADAALECVLYADQQQNLFAYDAYDAANPPQMTCDGNNAITVNQAPPSASRLISTARMSLDNGQRCADIMISKPPPNTGSTYLFAQGYDMPCSIVTTPNGARFASRGISAKYGGSAAGGACGTGGTVTVVGGNCVHTFTANGTLVPPSGLASLTYLVVAGGGGGGNSPDRTGGGGGAGGVLTGTLTPTASMSVTVGAGGAADTKGSNSVFGGVVTATGGGRGGQGGRAPSIGGSGGGGYHGATTGAAGTAGQGDAGGRGYDGADFYNATFGAGGGGGASQAGANGSATSGGKGGDGYLSSITGSPVYYGGGGGGGAQGIGTYINSIVAGAGGLGGGGAGGLSGTAGTAGMPNTGGGGGGGSVVNTGTGANGGAGGSGVIIISYPKPAF